MINVKELGALGNGTADDAAIINSAIASVSAAGGGVVLLPAGVYMVGSSITLRDNVTLQGSGIGATIIRQKASTALNATVLTLNAYSLWGTGSISGPSALNIRDLQIDANRQNGATGDGLALYAPLFSIDNIEVCNASGYGVRTEFGTPGIIPHGYSAQCSMNNSWVHDNNGAGVYWGGPSDSSLVNCHIYRNLNYNLWLALPAGSGMKVINCHCWGSTFDARQAGTGCRCDSPGNLLMNNVFEGSLVHQVHLRSSGNVIQGGNIYYASDSTFTYGVTMGDSLASSVLNTIRTKIDNCWAGAIYYANSGGLNQIDVMGYNAGSVPSAAIAGTIPLSDYVNTQLYGDVPVSSGCQLHIPLIGNVTRGAPDSGGSGYRALIAPN